MANIVVPLTEIESDARVLTQTVPRKVRLQGDNFPIESREFPQSGLQARYFQCFLPDYSSGLALDIFWYATGSTTGTVTWQAAVAAVTPGDPDRLDQKAFASLASASAVSVSADKTLRVSSITTIATDSLAAGDMLILKVQRDQADAGAGASAFLLGVALKYVSV